MKRIIRILSFIIYITVFPLEIPASALSVTVSTDDVEEGRTGPLERIGRDAANEVARQLADPFGGHLREFDRLELGIHFVGSQAAYGRALGGRGEHEAPEPWVAGLAFPAERRTIIDLSTGEHTLKVSETVRHEVSHLLLPVLTRNANLPRWYHEGLAMHLAGEDTAERLRDAVPAAVFGHMTTLDALTDAFLSGNRASMAMAYAQAAGFVRFVLVRTGEDKLGELHARLSAGVPFVVAFEATYRTSPETAYVRFVRDRASRSSWLAWATNEGVLWSLVSVLFLLVGLKRFLDARKRMKQLNEESGERRDDEDAEAGNDEDLGPDQEGSGSLLTRYRPMRRLTPSIFRKDGSRPSGLRSGKPSSAST